MLVEAVLALTTAILAPLVCLATILLLPFADRRTQALLVGSWTSYIALVGTVIL